MSKKNHTRVLIIDPPSLRPAEYHNVVSNTPLASSLLTGYAFSRLKEAGRDVFCLDSSGQTDLLSFRKNIEALKPGKIIVNLVFQWENTVKILETLRAARAVLNAELILFGYFPTFFKNELLRDFPFIDSVIQGDPFYERQSESDPFPLVAANGGCAPVLASRGCWGNCSFCYAGRFFKGYRNRDVKDIVNEVELRLENGFKKIYFVDPCFFPPGTGAKKYAEDLSREILMRGLRFPFGLECRPDSISAETIDPLAEAGLEEIFLGVESGSQSALNRFNKKLTVEDNERAINLLLQRKIKLSTGFIMFDPEVTPLELKENLDFLRRNRLLSCATNAAQLLSHKVFLYAGAPLYKKHLREFSEGGIPPYFMDYPLRDSQAEKIHAAMDKEAKKVYKKFKGKDIDTPDMKGSRETAKRLAGYFEELLH